MTGYGRAQDILNGREITAEVRSVNHRYFEFSARIPRGYSYLEEKIKAFVQQRVARGKIELNLTIIDSAGSVGDLTLNMDVARSYAGALDRVSQELGVKNDVSVALLSRMPEVLEMRRTIPDEEQLWLDVQGVLAAATDRFCSMRASEGQKMLDDIRERLKEIHEAVGKIESQSALRLERYRERLTDRMRQVLESSDIDDNRILLEAALYADKTAVDEETVRLRSHLEQFEKIVLTDDPVGRKLDFLLQEVNREVNTIGSKAADYGMTSVVVDVKADIEKIREQIQNIE